MGSGSVGRTTPEAGRAGNRDEYGRKRDADVSSKP
jgi:hypothetical protein